jgi:LysR family cyn operon transcriptional activator
MEFRQLRYFLAVADSLSFTRAAAELHLTQPTLSQQIKQLENRLGTPLFDRVGRKVRLTAPGVVFRQHAERALKEMHSATDALAELEGMVRGTLSIGVFQSFNSSLLPPILARFSATYSGVTVAVRQLPTGQMEEYLAAGELDLGIAYGPPASERIIAEKLFEEELSLVVGEAHPYARRREIHIRELRDDPLILLGPEFPSRRLLTESFVSAGFEPRIRIEINSTDAILATVKCSRLATIQTKRMTSAFPGLHCVRLKPRLTREVAIFWRRDGYRSTAARAAAEMIRKAHSHNRASSTRPGRNTTDQSRSPEPRQQARSTTPRQHFAKTR